MSKKKIAALVVSLALALALLPAVSSSAAVVPASDMTADFNLVVEVFEWGSATTGVIIDMGFNIDGAGVSADTFSVSAKNTDPDLTPAAGADPVKYEGPRTVVNAYTSATKEMGVPTDSGRYIVLELKHGYDNTASQVDGCAALVYNNGNNYLLQEYAVELEGSLPGLFMPVAFAQKETLYPDISAFEYVQNPVEGFEGEHYRVYIPEGKSDLPLVLWNHGGGEIYSDASGGNQGSQLFANEGGMGWLRSAPEDCVVLAPQQGGGEGAPGYSRPGVIAYINYLAEQGVVDDSRLYVTGCSFGGMETLYFIAEYPEVWAAAAPICPGIDFDADDAAAVAGGDFPVWVVNAATDDTVSPAAVRDFVTLLDDAGVDVYHTEFPDVRGLDIPNEFYAGETYNGHWSWIPLLNNFEDPGEQERGNFMDWLFAQRGIDLPDGATFERVDGVDMEDNLMYVYTASVLNNPPPMLTPVFYVYADGGFANRAAAYDYIVAAGLVDLAEAEKAVIMVMNPVDGAWGARDLEAYRDSWKYIDFVNGVKKVSYFQNIYVIGEAAGATFVNQHMSQDAKRVAGVLTVGGDVPAGVPATYQIPAYVAGGSQAAVDYYKATNTATVEAVSANGKPEFRNAVNDLARVVVDADATALTPDVANAAWKAIFSRTVRQSVLSDIWSYPYNEDLFELMDRPVASELGLTVFDVGYNWTGSNVGTGWFEWVPNEALDPANEAKYPLVVVLHGSNDHPVYEAESNGWVHNAGADRLILAAPITDDGAYVHAMIDELVAKYPVDESRIYISGFSRGGNNTHNITSYDDPKYGSYKRFAGMAPLAPSGVLFDAGSPIDIPYFYIIGSRDGLTRNTKAAVAGAFALNNIVTPDGAVDAFWGVPLNESETLLTKNGATIDINTYYNASGVPMAKLAVTDGYMHTHYVPNGLLAWEYLKNFSRDLETGDVVYTSTVGVEAEATTVYADDAEFTFKATGLSNVNLIALTFETKTDVLNVADFSFEGMNGFTAFEPKFVDLGNGNAAGSVVFGVIAGGETVSGDVAIGKLSVAVKKLGTVTLKITGLKVQGIEDVADEAVSVVKGASIHPSYAVTLVMSPFDVDKDNDVDGADLSLAFYYYTAREGDANWDTPAGRGAKRCDVDGNGAVDITDLTAIYSNYIK